MNYLFRYALVVAIFALPSLSISAVPYGYGDGVEFNVSTDNPISLGSGNDFFGEYTLGLFSTSNVTRASSEERSANAAFLGVGTAVRRDTGKSLFWVGVDARSIAHDGFNQADSLDANGLFAGELNRGGMNRLRFNLGSRLGHDALGDEQVVANQEENIDRWRQDDFGLNYHLGRNSTRLGLDLFIEGRSKEYLNNRSSTETLDYSRFDYGMILTAAYSSKTQFLAGGRYSDVAYDESSAAQLRDADVARHFLGVRWLATAKTSGEVRVGLLERKPKNGGDSESGFSWRALVDWKPRTYSTVRLAADVVEEETILSSASFVQNSTITLSWAHAWNAYWDTSSYVRYRESEYFGLSSTRADSVSQVGVSLGYKLNRKTQLRFNTDVAKRDSDDNSFDYRRVDFSVSVKAGF